MLYGESESVRAVAVGSGLNEPTWAMSGIVPRGIVAAVMKGYNPESSIRFPA